MGDLQKNHEIQAMNQLGKSQFTFYPRQDVTSFYNGILSRSVFGRLN
jgi:hypothetical protein